MEKTIIKILYENGGDGDPLVYVNGKFLMTLYSSDFELGKLLSKLTPIIQTSDNVLIETEWSDNFGDIQTPDWEFFKDWNEIEKQRIKS